MKFTTGCLVAGIGFATAVNTADAGVSWSANAYRQYDYDNSNSNYTIGNWDYSYGNVFADGTSWLTGTQSGFTWSYEMNSPATTYLDITSSGTIVADTDTLVSATLQTYNLTTKIETVIYLKDTVTGDFLDLSGNDEWPPNEVTLLANRPYQIEAFTVTMEIIDGGGPGLHGEFGLLFGELGIPGPGGLLVMACGGLLSRRRRRS